MARTKIAAPPQVGDTAPDFTLPGALGGQLRLSIRVARGPVIVVFYRGVWSEECVEYFGALAQKEREINVAGATLVGIGAVEPDEAREFSRKSGFNSYVLYDYIREATRAYGLLEKDAEHGDAARPAVFFVDAERVVRHAWLDERPSPDELLAKVSEITGLPRELDEEEAEEKPKKRPRKAAKSETGEEEESPKSESAESEPSKSETPEKTAGGKRGSGEEAKAESAEAAENDGETSGGEAGESQEQRAGES